MIEISRLNFDYPAQPLLRNIHLNIPVNGFVALIGPNGAGKSTLLKLAAGLLSPQTGKIHILKKPLAAYSRRELAKVIGYVAQNFESVYSFSAEEIVLMGRYPYLSPFERESKGDRAVIRSAMESTEVWHLRHRLIHELSGGELQRVILASALAQEPRLLLLDEPTTALDLKHQVQFYRILESLRREKAMTIVTVTHDVNLAIRFCERLVVMKDGAIVAEGSPGHIITPGLVKQVYELDVEIIPHPKDGKPLLLL